MSLLKDIISEATAKRTDTPRMLRLCMVLASKLKHEPLRAWVMHELEGYPVDAPLPSYRILRGRNRGQFVGHGIQGVLDIPTTLLPKSIQPYYEKVELRDCIGEYAHLLEKTAEGGGGLQIPWPVGLAVKYASKHVTNGQCISAWIDLSDSELAGMLDKVKTKVLSFALEIEAEAPNAGEIERLDNQPIQEERVSQIFNTTIQGNVQNYSAGGSNINQTAVGSVQAGDLGSLLAVLRASGVSEDDVTSLQSAIAQDTTNGASGMGEAVKGWLADMTIKAGQGLAGIGADVVSQVVAQAVLAFLGVST